MSTWVVWRDAGGNLGVAAYPDHQLARYACNALDRVVLAFAQSRHEALGRLEGYRLRFAAIIDEDEGSGDYLRLWSSDPRSPKDRRRDD